MVNRLLERRKSELRKLKRLGSMETFILNPKNLQRIGWLEADIKYRENYND